MALPLNVFLVCDNPSVSQGLKNELAALGITVVSAPFVNIGQLCESLQILPDTPPNAVLVCPTDQTDAINLTRNEYCKSIPFVLIQSDQTKEFDSTLFDGRVERNEIKWLPILIPHLANAKLKDMGQPSPSSQTTSQPHESISGITKSLSLLKATFESTADALLVLDTDNKIVQYNTKFLKMWQVSAEVLDTSSAQELSDLFASQMSVKKSFTDIHSADYIDPNLVSSDSLEFIDGRKYEVYSQPQILDGQTVGRVWSFRDVTIRKKIEKELHESNSKLRTIVHNLRGVVFSCKTDDDLTMQFISQGIEELSGYPVSDFLNNRHLPSIILKNDLPQVAKEIAKAFYQSPPLSLEFRIICADGTEKWVWLRGSVVLDSFRNTMIEGYISDITENKKAQLQLEWAKNKSEESDKLKTAFLHNISHEIRTPINAILGFARLLEDDTLPIEKRRRFNQVILSSANHLVAIIDDVVDMAAIEAQQVNLKAEPIDLAEMLRTLYVQYAAKFKDKGLTIRCIIDPQLDGILYMADNTKLIQILTNLLNNAFKFTQQGGVTFGIEKSGNGLRFFVKDTGIGIPPEMHSRIFERFAQVDIHARLSPGGMGLGLAICKAYVEMMGGVIGVSSQLGNGAEFFFTLHLPKSIATEPVHEPTASKTIYPTNQGDLILIAEDEQTNFLLLSEMLNVLNVQYIRATNGQEAIDACKQHPHLKMVLMDIKMPIMDGLEATRKIRTFSPQVPIVAVTAYTYSHTKKQVLEAGCTDYITKPISFSGLKALVAKYI